MKDGEVIGERFAVREVTRDALRACDSGNLETGRLRVFLLVRGHICTPV